MPQRWTRTPRRRRPPAKKPVLTSYGRTASRPVFSRQAVERARRRRVVGTVSLVAVLGIAAAAFLWLWSRPVSLAVAASPADATVAMEGGPRARGTLRVADLEPGDYRVVLARTGFETRTVAIEVPRFRGTSVRIALKATPQSLRLSATPADAAVTIARDGKPVATGTGSVACTLPAGEVSVAVAYKGCNPYKRTMVLDRRTSLDVRLDPAGQLVHVLGHVECAGAPKGVALTPDGSEAWTTILNGPPSIEIFDPRTGKRVGAIDLGTHGAVEVCFNRAGTRAYASQMETAKVFEIDVARRRVLRELATESTWTKVVALSPDEKTLYAANWSGNDVSEIDLKSGRVRRRIPVADTPRGLWPSSDGKTLWVASFGDGVLERVNLATGKVARVFSGGEAMRHLVADERRGLLYTSDMGRDCVWVTDMKSGKTRKFATVGHKPNTIDLSPDGRVLFVSNRGENNSTSYYLPGPEWGSVLLLDTTTGKPLDGIVGGNQCTALDVSGDGKVLVFSDFLDDRLRVYEVPGYATLTRGAPGRADTLAADVSK